MPVGPKIIKSPCIVCGSTIFYKANNRCTACNLRYLSQYKATRMEREGMRGKPCQICSEPMEQPCFDEAGGVRRGWLCHHCNRGLGQFHHDQELLRRAIIYLS